MTIDNLNQIIIGREDDGGVSLVEIDCASWRAKHPQLTDYRLEVTSPAGVVYFPVIQMAGDVLVWEIRQSDTAVKGAGRYQVVATGGEGEKKTSDNARVVVMAVMPGTASDVPPDPAKPWTDKVMEAAKRIEEAGGVTDEQVAAAVESYLEKNPIEGGEIDDTTPSEKTTYSSKKIEAELSKLKEASGRSEDVFNLVETFTVTDATEKNYDFSSEADGTPYAFTRMMIVVDAEQGAADDTVSFAYGSYSLCYATKGILASGAARTTCLLDTFAVNEAKEQKRVLYARCNQQGYASDTAQFAWQTRGYGCPPRLTVPFDGIDKIRIQAALPVGSTIKIYAMNGKTPEKGVDYWTEEDKEEIVNDVLAALPVWEGGAY